MGKLSNFFRKFSIDKFPKDSQGRRLNDPKPVNDIKHEQSASGSLVPRAPPSEGSLKAADAALNRFAAKQVKSKSAIQRQVEAETARAKQQLQDAEAMAAKFTTNTVTTETGGALQKVSFWCPSLLDDKLRGTYAEVDTSIERALLDESQVDPAGAYTLLVIRSIEASQFPATVSPNDESAASLQGLREKRKQNFVTIIRNLIEHPEKEAFRRLRMSNKLVSDLLGLKYATEFFEVCGFKQIDQPTSSEDGPSVEKYLVFPAAPTDEQLRHLKSMLDLFQSGQPIVPKLCRDTTVLKATGNNFRALTKDELPPEFFFVSRDDLRRAMVEQQKEIDEGGMLLTKAMRERLKVRERRIYRYVLIRVKIPGDVLLQGTFMASETVDDIRTWISSCFVDQTITYRLLAPPGQISSASGGNRPMTAWVSLEDCESTSTLVDLGLAPCAILTLSLDSEAQLTQKTTIKFLPELEQQMLPLTQ